MPPYILEPDAGLSFNPLSDPVKEPAPLDGINDAGSRVKHNGFNGTACIGAKDKWERVDCHNGKLRALRKAGCTGNANLMLHTAFRTRAQVADLISAFPGPC
jgi:hypothetical protein